MYATEANHDQTSSQIFLYRIHPSAYLVFSKMKSTPILLGRDGLHIA